MDEEQNEAVNTPKELRTERQKEIIYGNCDSLRDLKSFELRKKTLVDRLEKGLYLTKADKKEALRYTKKPGR